MRIPTLPTLTAATALAATAVLGAAAAAPAADGDDDGHGRKTGSAGERGRGVVVQPTRVAPGGDFSVFDGGNCAAETGTASFVPPPGGTRLPDLDLEPLSNMVGAVSALPEDAAPGYYKVTVRCDDGGGPFTGSFTVTKAARDAAERPGGDADAEASASGSSGRDDADPEGEEPHGPGRDGQRTDEDPADPHQADEGGRQGGAGNGPPEGDAQHGGEDRHGDGGAHRQEDGSGRDGGGPGPWGGHDTGATEHRAHGSPVPQGGVATGVGGSTAADTTSWGLGGAGVLALIGGALWYRRHGRA